MHHTPLLSTIVVGIVLAFAFGAIAHRLKASPLVGYLLAGVVIGPFTPGFVADQTIANELSEIGVILLMFGVGLQFSLEELLSVRAIAVPGALVQIIVASALGAGLAHLLGWSLGAGLIFGLALSVASTVVVLRSMQERRLLDTERGRIAVGWLVVEDLVMVLVLVFVPALGDLSHGLRGLDLSAVALPLAITLGKFAAFLALMWIVGRRLIPWLLHYVAHTGSRELFRLAVLAIALGVAYGAATLFQVSFALGAFFAGMILSEFTLSQRAAQETLPLRDAFAVLFFVSVGMLFNPGVIMSHPFALLATILIVTVVKSGVAYGMMRLFRYPESTALMIAASRAQVGEFSFILVGLGVALSLLPPVGRDLVLAAALISILLTPFLFAAADWIRAHQEPPKPAATRRRQNPSRPRCPHESRCQSRNDGSCGAGRLRTRRQRGRRNACRSQSAPFWSSRATRTSSKLCTGKASKRSSATRPIRSSPEPQTTPAARCLWLRSPMVSKAGRSSSRHAGSMPVFRSSRARIPKRKPRISERHGASKVIMGEHLIAHAMIDDARAAISPHRPRVPPRRPPQRP